jgi:hypothetical protein
VYPVAGRLSRLGVVPSGRARGRAAG